MTEFLEKDAKSWEDQLLRIVIVIGVFPVLVEVLHFLLTFPLAIVGYWLVHLEGHLKFWARTMSIIALLPACWGAWAICKWIWPRSN